MLTARGWINRILLGVNVVMFVVLLLFFVTRGASFSPPWDGPAVVTIVLTAVTVVLGAVALGVALLAVWGYSALREHAGNIADKAATAAADKAVQKLLRDWGLDGTKDDSQSEDIAKAYSGETSGE